VSARTGFHYSPRKRLLETQQSRICSRKQILGKQAQLQGLIAAYSDPVTELTSTQYRRHDPKTETWPSGVNAKRQDTQIMARHIVIIHLFRIFDIFCLSVYIQMVEDGVDVKSFDF
jgi:hypothetical protein